MIDYRKLNSMKAAILKDGATNANNESVTLALIEAVISLQREIDQVNSVASRADRNARMFVGARR